MAGFNGIFYNGVFSCGWDFSTAPSACGDSFINGGGVISSSFAFGAGQGIKQSGSFWGKSFGVNLATTLFGFWYNPSVLPSGGNFETICVWYDSTTGAAQTVLGFNSQGQVQWFRGGNPLGGVFGTAIGSLSSTLVRINTFQFIEGKTTVNGTTGLVECRIAGNPTPVASFTGNTQATGNAYANRFYVGETIGGGAAVSFDHLYGLDLTGTGDLATYLGPGRVQTDVPSNNSATVGLNQWTPTNPTNVNYTNVGNNPANVAQYNASGTVGQRESYQYPAFTNTTKVFFLSEWFSSEIDAAGVRTLAPSCRSNAVDFFGPAVSLGGSYAYFNQPYTVDPNTSANISAGTVAAAGNIELGVEVAS